MHISWQLDSAFSFPMSCLQLYLNIHFLSKSLSVSFDESLFSLDFENEQARDIQSPEIVIYLPPHKNVLVELSVSWSLGFIRL